MPGVGDTEAGGICGQHGGSQREGGMWRDAAEIVVRLEGY